MTPTEIKINLIKSEVSQAAIAARAGVSRAHVTRVIKRQSKSARVQAIIARAINCGYEEVWHVRESAA